MTDTVECLMLKNGDKIIISTYRETWAQSNPLFGDFISLGESTSYIINNLSSNQKMFESSLLVKFRPKNLKKYRSPETRGLSTNTCFNFSQFCLQISFITILSSKNMFWLLLILSPNLFYRYILSEFFARNGK